MPRFFLAQVYLSAENIKDGLVAINVLEGYYREIAQRNEVTRF